MRDVVKMKKKGKYIEGRKKGQKRSKYSASRLKESKPNRSYVSFPNSPKNDANLDAKLKILIVILCIFVGSILQETTKNNRKKITQ